MSGPVHPDQSKIDLRKQARSQAWADQHGMTVVAGVVGPQAVPEPVVLAFHHSADFPTHSNLVRFADWRVSKCKPRDYAVAADHRGDLDQGTLELVGETGEVAELVLGLDGLPAKMADPEFRGKLIDEIGDVFFCASWLGDAWKVNPIRVSALGNLAVFEEEHRTIGVLERATLELCASAGLLANSAKKVLCQGRTQDTQVQHNRLSRVFHLASMILSVVDARWPEALARNIEKLDARWPAGTPMTGGGIRTGKGA